MTPGWKPRHPCIICDKNEGLISTLDGEVCPTCMPMNLYSGAENLHKYQIIIYNRSNNGPDYRNCEELFQKDKKPVEYSDRSRVITQNDDICLLDEIRRNIPTADSIDIIVAFINSKGLNAMIDDLREFTKTRRLRILTTTYSKFTDFQAVVDLMSLPNTTVKVEMVTGDSRLHAKAFIFHRSDGTSTAFVGSANITYTALTTGEEWVVEFREQDLPQAFDDVTRAFASKWNDPVFFKASNSNLATIEAQLN